MKTMAQKDSIQLRFTVLLIQKLDGHMRPLVRKVCSRKSSLFFIHSEQNVRYVLLIQFFQCFY